MLCLSAFGALQPHAAFLTEVYLGLRIRVFLSCDVFQHLGLHAFLRIGSLALSCFVFRHLGLHVFFHVGSTFSNLRFWCSGALFSHIWHSGPFSLGCPLGSLRCRLLAAGPSAGDLGRSWPRSTFSWSPLGAQKCSVGLRRNTHFVDDFAMFMQEERK